MYAVVATHSSLYVKFGNMYNNKSGMHLPSRSTLCGCAQFLWACTLMLMFVYMNVCFCAAIVVYCCSCANSNCSILTFNSILFCFFFLFLHTNALSYTHNFVLYLLFVENIAHMYFKIATRNTWIIVHEIINIWWICI